MILCLHSTHLSAFPPYGRRCDVCCLLTYLCPYCFQAASQYYIDVAYCYGWSVGLSVTVVSLAKMSKPVEMLYRFYGLGWAQGTMY